MVRRPDSPLTPAEGDALWEYAARTAADATGRIRFYIAAGNPAAAADAACAASDALHVVAAALGAVSCVAPPKASDRAARQPWGRIPAPTPAGNQLRHAARLLSAYAYITGDRTLTPVVLLVKLAALAEAIAELRESHQAHPHQAARQTCHRHHTTSPAETSPATPGHRRRTRSPQLPHHVPAPPASTRPAARTRPAAAATATTATATTATRTHPLTTPRS